MTGQFEQEVNAALQIFIAAVTRAAERTAVETIRSACARASPRAVRAVGDASDSAPSSAKPAPRRASAPMNDAAVRRTVVAYLRENPGKSPTRLGLTLGIYHGTLRRHLNKLVDDRTIRIEERLVGFGRQRHRACFLVEHVNPAAAESPAVPAEAMA